MYTSTLVLGHKIGVIIAPSLKMILWGIVLRTLRKLPVLDLSLWIALLEIVDGINNPLGAKLALSPWGEILSVE
jgi:hypothetical protein